MRFYNHAAQHIAIFIEQMSKDLGLDVVDKAKLKLDKGDTSIGFVVGDCNPGGFNQFDQEKLEVEVEIQIFVPTSKASFSVDSPQLYTLSLSSKIAGLIAHSHYGFDEQRETPIIQINSAIPSNYNNEQAFIARSIVFTQVVYVGEPFKGLTKSVILTIDTELCECPSLHPEA